MPVMQQCPMIMAQGPWCLVIAWNWSGDLPLVQRKMHSLTGLQLGYKEST